MGSNSSKQVFGLDNNESKAPAYDGPPGSHDEDPIVSGSPVNQAEVRQQKVLQKIQSLDAQYADRLFGGNPSNASRMIANASELQKNLQVRLTDRDNREQASSSNDVPIKIVLIGEPNFLWRTMAQLQGYQYNAMHVALQVGEKLVDWCDHSLVYPRPMKATTAFAVIEVGVLNLNDDKDKLDELCRMMEYWNVNEKYDQKKKNCQHFVDEALKVLKLDLPKEGPIVEFLNAIRKGKLDKEIPSLGSFDPNAPKTFETHLQIDEYFIKLLKERYPGRPISEAANQFKSENPDVYNLLKGFDRAFWILRFTTPENPKGMCYSENGRNCCPFPFSEKTVSDENRRRYGSNA